MEEKKGVLKKKKLESFENPQLKPNIYLHLCQNLRANLLHPWKGGCCEVKLLDAKTKGWLGFFCKTKNAQGNLRIAWKINTDNKIWFPATVLWKGRILQKRYPLNPKCLIQALPRRLLAQKAVPLILPGGEVILPKPNEQYKARQSSQEEIQLLTLLEILWLRDKLAFGLRWF